MALTPASWRVFRRRFLTSCVAALVVIVASVLVINNVVNRKLDAAERIPDIKFPPGPAQGGNYLIIGSDSRAFVSDPGQERAFGSKVVETGQRADVMMVLHLDPTTKTSLLVSFPRDLLVDLPSGGRGMINATFSGGPQEIIDTLRSNFNIKINHYVEVNFKAFIGVVDAVGTVNVFFPNPTRDTSSGLDIPLAGCVAMNGDSGLAFVRSRHREELIDGRWRDKSGASDLDRIGRQQDFIRKLASKASATASGNPLDALNIADAVVSKIKIDDQLGRDDILRLVNTFRHVDPTQDGALEMKTLPVGSAPTDRNRLVVKEAEAAPLLQQLRTFGGAPSNAPVNVQPRDVTVRVLNGSGKNGAAGRALGLLQEQSFGPGPQATGDFTATAKTQIRYQPNGRAKAELLAQYLGGVGELIEDSTLTDVDVSVVIGADWRGVQARNKSAKPAGTSSTSAARSNGAGSKTTATTKPPAGPVC